MSGKGVKLTLRLVADAVFPFDDRCGSIEREIVVLGQLSRKNIRMSIVRMARNLEAHIVCFTWVRICCHPDCTQGIKVV
jgi:hypothetical protein